VDEPMFTQPLMYRKIRGIKNVLEKYGGKLLSEGVVKEEEVKDVKDKYERILEEAYTSAQTVTSIKYKVRPWTRVFLTGKGTKNKGF
jgi:2-oxoglutarate dehydrogenase E1 component